MRSAIYLGKKNINLIETAIPKPGPKDVLIHNLNSSICGSDVAVYEHGTKTGHKISVGSKFGHEMVSEIVEVGSAVTDFQVGQRVYPYPLYAAGDPSKAGTLGGFTEYLLIKNAKLNHDLYLIPPTIPNEVAALTEPFTVATRAVKRAHPQTGDHACVYGAGTIGIAAAFALRHLGCTKVMVVDHSDYRLSLARSFGFATVNSAKENLTQKQLEYFKPGMSLAGTQANINITIDAVGVPEILQDYLDSKVVDSRIVLIGVDKADQEINLLQMIFASQAVIGSGGYRPNDVETVFEIFRENANNIQKIVTKILPWEKLVEGIELAANPNKALNVQVKY